MKRLRWPLLAATAIFLGGAPIALSDKGQASPTLSFFSGGGGAHADWFATSDQPPGDTDNQAIRLLTTTASSGFAGILVHHVTGIPAAEFPDSSFWLKAPPNNGTGATFGSPRLVVEFQNAEGKADGNAELDQNLRGTNWQQVSDVSDYPNSGWDIHSKTCLFMYHKKWSVAQSCHSGDTVSTAFIVADPYGIYHLIDDINVDGKEFSNAADNSNGDNTAAGPAASDPSLIPPSLLPLP